MEGAGFSVIAVSIALFLINALCVMAEYGLVGVRRSRIEALAKRGSKNAKVLLAALDQMADYVSGVQVAITMCGIGIGAITEPMVTRWLTSLFGDAVPRAVAVAISIFLVTYILVVAGELVPKFITLKHAERVALALIRPLAAFVAISKPVVWLVQRSGALVLLPFKIRMDQLDEDTLSRDELSLLIRSGGREGAFEEGHAQVMARALKLDSLDAADIMIHRLDIKWIDLSTPREEILAKITRIPHSRVPVCRGDIDELVGVLYLQDLLRHLESEAFNLESLLRPAEYVPENLTLDRIVQRMREGKTQILFVADEYGGVSGLITLEDVVEEVFGELEDQIESERPPIESVASHRLSVRAEVRYDELLDYLGIEPDGDALVTDSLATLIIEKLGRVPKLGDWVESPGGILRVENMARRRITRVAVQVAADPKRGPGSAA